MPLSPLQQLLAVRLHERAPVQVQVEGASEAAVAVIVAANPDSILLIRRAERSGDPWSGHIGLPGGRRERQDEHLLATAIRETLEEVGIGLGPDNLLGVLDDVAPRTWSGKPIFARPFVFGLYAPPSPSPNAEVTAAAWIPIETFGRPEILRDFTLEVGGSSRTFPAFHLELGTVWGMTERILTSVLAVIAA